MIRIFEHVSQTRDTSYEGSSVLFQSQPQDNVQAVEDSGEGDDSGEQTDITAGQSESTDGNEDRGVGRAEAANDEGHHGESSAVQASADTSQQVSERSPRYLRWLCLFFAC